MIARRSPGCEAAPPWKSSTSVPRMVRNSIRSIGRRRPRLVSIVHMRAKHATAPNGRSACLAFSCSRRPKRTAAARTTTARPPITARLFVSDGEDGTSRGCRAAGDIADDLVDYFLFIDEAPLPARVISTSGFAQYFEGSGMHDTAGRSLRELDL